MQSFKSPSNINISSILNINGCIINKPSSFELFIHGTSTIQKLHNIKLSCSVFRITIFFQFNSTKSTLNILLKYAHDLDKNINTLYTKLAVNNNYDHKSYDVRQQVLSYSALLTLCSDELSDCKPQITQLTLSPFTAASIVR